jgi:hypothetical protein|tara:strand:+ start:928 stop:1050 length:123 start_codon:yes stop_codon:yes gene_type:complete
MRGGISITEAYELTGEDRKIIADIIKDNIKTAEKTKQPFW